MRGIKELSQMTGISIRALRYYDEIGLLKPAGFTEGGYRLYDDKALERLLEILFFKELKLSLGEIKVILDNPAYDRREILKAQKEMLIRKRNRLKGILELIDDVMEGVNTMSFEVFGREDAEKIVKHNLELLHEDSKKEIIERFGSVENYQTHVAESLQEAETSARLIKIYGSKDKAVEASLQANGDMETLLEGQEETDRLYKQFAQAMKTADTELAMDAVKKLAENYKKLFHLDNARELLLEMADLKNSVLEEAADKQYGAGVYRYVGEAIQRYYGI